MSGSRRNTAASSEQKRPDGELFNDEYLTSVNRGVAESVLWPVPVLQQETVEVYQAGGVELRPGDVLEYIGGSREEFCLIVGILNNEQPAVVLCYSTNTESFEGYCPIQPAQGMSFNVNTDVVAIRDQYYGVHHDVVDPVDDSPVASISFVEDSPLNGEYEMRMKDGYYPYAEQPTPLSPNYPRGTYHVDANVALSASDIEDSLFVGDAWETLQRMPDNVVHSWVTSPPYPNAQRDYDVDGQIGSEDDPAKYLDSLLSIVLQAMRVTRDDGVGWLVIDDAILDGEYLGIPDRLVGALRKEGFNVIHNGPWVKGGGKPDPAPNRFAHDHERVIGITNSDSYYFDRRGVEADSDVIRQPTSAQSDFDIDDELSEIAVHDAKFSIELAEQLLGVSTPASVCPECGAPFEPQYEVTDILDLEDNRHKERVLDAFHRTPEMTREHARACRAVGLSHTGQAARTEDGSGQNSERVQELIEEVKESDFPSSYIREFSYAKRELVGYDQACCCDGVSQSDADAGIVLDPFVGSGTTCVAAIRQDRHYAGIDLREEYISLARERLTNGVDSSLSQFMDV
jgi:hypothetical protein